MPTYRKLHTKIVDSFDFAEMPDDFVRVFWLLLIVTADSEGRMINQYAWLRSRMFPMRSDVTDTMLEEAVTWLAQKGMIVSYEVNGHQYFYVTKFKEYQTGTERETKSVLPAPEYITHELLASNSRVTQELLMSNSGVTHELLRPTCSGTNLAVSASASVSVNESVFVSESAVNPPEPQLNIYRLYESEIGLITPAIADRLKDAESEYPFEWIKLAIHEAVVHNARNWSYISAILRSWKTKGAPSTRKSGNGSGQPAITQREAAAIADALDHSDDDPVLIDDAPDDYLWQSFAAEHIKPSWRGVLSPGGYSEDGALIVRAPPGRLAEAEAKFRKLLQRHYHTEVVFEEAE